MSEFNGSFLGVRESSSATPEFVEEYAVRRANEKSEGAELDQFFIVFNSKTNTFGLAFSDGLKESLGFEKSYYYLVSESNSNELVVPNNDLFPNETAVSEWLNNLDTSISELINRAKTEFESSITVSASKKIDELISEIDITIYTDQIKTATTTAKSEITKHLNAKKDEIVLEENAKIADLETKISQLETTIEQLSVGLSESEVLELIENNQSSTESTDSGISEDEIINLINERLDTFTLDSSDPANVNI